MGLKNFPSWALTKIFGLESEPRRVLSSHSNCSDEEQRLLTEEDHSYFDGQSYVEPNIPSLYGSMVPVPQQIQQHHVHPWGQMLDDHAHGLATVRHEFAELLRLGSPTVIAYLLQSSEQFSTVFSLGHLGKEYLAASSLSTMTAAITAFSIFQGIISSLDTLATQAFGANKPYNVATYFQRCCFILLLLHIPIALIWLNLEHILVFLRQDPKVAYLCGRYMKVFIFAAPAYASFEAMKRYLQSQGIFKPITCVLCFAAPLNVLLNYLLVWHPKIGFGFLGAPTAVAITFWFQSICLLSYARFSSSVIPWTHFSMRAVQNLRPMLTLSFYGMLMIVTEWAAYEMTSLGAGYLGTASLASQSVLLTTTSLAFQIPFAFAVASSTRVGHLVGSGRPNLARICSRVATCLAVIISMTDGLLLFCFRNYWGRFFTSDQQVLNIVRDIFAILCIFIVFDALNAVGGGLLRGIGKQSIGGAISIIVNYFFALPITVIFVVVLQLGLKGIWMGMIVAVTTGITCQYTVLGHINWQKILQEAHYRMAHV
ncbi:MatE family transporter [Schizosaccharomyces cryophilus OY26]|uniref:MatE family transporter n=1 Tax=Schizosaccharomyces cryophilus (strain OY26 / ATCC MYA-4695 / CBS 11777 / NBRC 106824 / NRRL Y48691) TaxID=653667 RepID=S9X329_SCHCR|nr:MatE family transporter [Schizosaccharomyces cryophilus OY26]EPY51512.1 MatE family transporter [Schizosaccharomyces cryophilus OY26]